MNEVPEIETPEIVKPTMTEGQLSFVSLVHQYWMEEGVLLNAATCRKVYGVPEKEFNALITNELVKAALDERGVVLQKFGFDKTFTLEGEEHEYNTVLTPTQLIVANAMLDLTDTRSNKKKLQDLGMSTAKYNSWLKDPAFKQYMVNRAENMLGDTQHEAMLALLDKVSSGDLKAIQYYHELIGRFTPAAAKGATSNSQLDIQSLLISIVEIIADEVDDPNVAARISDRLKSLGQARTLAGEIMGITEETEIIRPNVAKPRELTPAMRELMESGAGVNG